MVQTPPMRYQSLLDWAEGKRKVRMFRETYSSSSPIYFADSPLSRKRIGGCRSAAVYVIEDGRVWGDHGTVLSPDNTLLWDVSVEWTTPKKHSIFAESTLPPLKKTSESIGVLAHIGGKGFYHWMFTVLPRYHLIRKNHIDVGHYLVNGCRSPYQRETLQLLGIPEEKIMEASPSLHIQSKRLVVPTLPGNVTGWACKFLKNSLMPKESLNIGKFDKVYVSRKDASWRKIVNEADLIHQLHRLGFHCIELENLTVKEQIRLFSGAQFVLGPHGAGLSNLVFCNPGAKVVELFAPRYIIPTYMLISHYAGLNYHYMVCHSESEEKLPHKSWAGADDISVNIPKLIKFIKKLM